MRVAATLIFLVLLVAGVFAFLFHEPYGPQKETFVEIAPRMGTAGMAAELERQGVIRSRWAFEALKVWQTFRGAKSLKAGEYRFDHPVSMTEVYDRIARGDVYTVGLTIPEGYNIFDIAAAVEAAGLGTKEDFLAAERAHTELIADWTANLPEKPASLEGYLFPDTYRFPRKVTPVQILAVMVRRFKAEVLGMGVPLDGNLPRVVTMASLVEKEVRQDAERPLVAGVFVNRLARGMPLATDPTVIYAALLNDRWRGTIYASDLAFDSPYNTYKHAGLPPGPICNPGVAALKAAIAPAKTEYLYFVSDAGGHSRFATTLKEHNENVEAYRKTEGR